MTKLLISGIIGLMMVFFSFAQQPAAKPMPSADRAKNTVERISKTVPFTQQQKTNLTAVFTTFYDDVRTQQAYKDPAKLEFLEKVRDNKVEKLLKNPKLYMQYQDAIKEMKAQFLERKRQQGKP